MYFIEFKFRERSPWYLFWNFWLQGHFDLLYQLFHKLFITCLFENGDTKTLLLNILRMRESKNNPSCDISLPWPMDQRKCGGKVSACVLSMYPDKFTRCSDSIASQIFSFQGGEKPDTCSVLFNWCRSSIPILHLCQNQKSEWGDIAILLCIYKFGLHDWLQWLETTTITSLTRMTHP